MHLCIIASVFSSTNRLWMQLQSFFLPARTKKKGGESLKGALCPAAGWERMPRRGRGWTTSCTAGSCASDGSTSFLRGTAWRRRRKVRGPSPPARTTPLQPVRSVARARMRHQRPRRAARRGSAGKLPRRSMCRAPARPAPPPALWRCARARADATCLARARRPAGSRARAYPACACAALIKSAEKKFHVSLSSLQRHSDPISIIQQHLEKGEVRLRPRERVCLRPQPPARRRFWLPRRACRAPASGLPRQGAPLTLHGACSLSWRTKNLMYGSRTSSRMWARSCTPRHCSRSRSNWRCNPSAPRAGKTTSMRLQSGAPSHRRSMRHAAIETVRPPACFAVCVYRCDALLCCLSARTRTQGCRAPG